MRHSIPVVKQESKSPMGQKSLIRTVRECLVKYSALLILSHLGISNLRADPKIPESLLDDQHVREEAGVNEFTSPSIDKIFKDLATLAPLPPAALDRGEPAKPPIQQGALALELGRLIADGFLMVQSGQTEKVEDLARQLNRYARALGIGDRVNRHAASLLDHAKNKRLDDLRDELKKTQEDVERELVLLRDPGLASLIGLGGWLRAYDAATIALEARYTPERIQLLLRPEVPDYFIAMMEALPPREQQQKTNIALKAELQNLYKTLEAQKGQEPTPELVGKLRAHAKILTAIQ